MTGRKYPTREPVDFVIVGSGAAGGVLAKELSASGFDVVVLEQGPYRTASDFVHDELGIVDPMICLAQRKRVSSITLTAHW